MERIITVTLNKDVDGKYSLNMSTLTTVVSVLDEDDDPINVRWVFLENPDNPGYPNARRMTASFDVIPTPFTITGDGEPLPKVENYSVAYAGDGSDVSTPDVQNGAVGPNQTDTKLYKYTVVVETNDNQQIVLDPHIRVRRRKLTRDGMLGY